MRTWKPHFSTLVLALYIGTVSAVAAADCGPVGTEVRNGRANFLSDDLTGRLAWLKDGRPSQAHFLLGECHTVFVGNTKRLYFIINNRFAGNQGDGSASFVAVQVAKLQRAAQADLDIIIERNDNWIRETNSQVGFGPVEVDKLLPRQFVEIHSNDPFDDQLLRFNEIWWHATPAGGVISSSKDPGKWTWQVPWDAAQSDRVLMSNRLYRFEFNADGNSGVPFEVGINGTEEVHIRVFSPIWPGEVFNHELKIN